MAGFTTPLDRGLIDRHRFKPAEALPWLVAIAWYFLLPDYLTLGYQIMIWILFALSLDLILGYAGIITLGHAAFFGTGAYAAGMMSVHLHWNEPISELLVAMAAAALVGAVSGWMVLRTKSLTLVMLTLATTILLQETGNMFESLTGGADGLRDVKIDPIFGAFRFDLWGRTGYP
jgi:branched-chain amino acid transport system permease protein